MDNMTKIQKSWVEGKCAVLCRDFADLSLFSSFIDTFFQNTFTNSNVILRGILMDMKVFPQKHRGRPFYSC